MQLIFTVVWFIGSIALKLAVKMLPVFLHELYILAAAGFDGTTNAVHGFVYNPQVRAFGARVEDEGVILYKKLGIREKIALFLSPLLAISLIVAYIHWR